MNTTTQPHPTRFHFSVLVAFITAVSTGCSALPEDAPVTPYEGDGPDYAIESSDIGCVSAYRRAGGLYLVNFLGLIEEAVDVAESDEGGVYPVGTLVQAIPGEAMIKRGPGFSEATADWEFLIVQSDGQNSAITARGTTDVENAGGTCAACHGKAEPQWDYVCLQNRGCDPIPASMTLFQTLRDSDARCTNAVTDDAEDVN